MSTFYLEKNSPNFLIGAETISTNPQNTPAGLVANTAIAQAAQSANTKPKITLTKSIISSYYLTCYN